MQKSLTSTLALVLLLTFSPGAFAFTLKLVSISGDRAEVLVNGMPRSFPIGFISREGIKLISASPGKASFQSGSVSFALAPGQSFDDVVCQDQQKNGTGLLFYNSPCGVSKSAEESERYRNRLDRNNAVQADRERMKERMEEAERKREFEAALRPPQKIR